MPGGSFDVGGVLSNHMHGVYHQATQDASRLLPWHLHIDINRCNGNTSLLATINRLTSSCQKNA